MKNQWKISKLNKKFEKGRKKSFDQLLGAPRAQKMVEIHNKGV